MRLKKIIFLSPILFLLGGCNSYRFKSDAVVACENWAARGGTLYFKSDHRYIAFKKMKKRRLMYENDEKRSHA